MVVAMFWKALKQHIFSLNQTGSSRKPSNYVCRKPNYKAADESQNERIEQNKCRICKYKYRNMTGNIKQIDGYSLIQLLKCSNNTKRLPSLFYQSVHLGCVLFRIQSFSRFYEEFRSVKGVEGFSENFFEIPILLLELEWLLVLFEESTLAERLRPTNKTEPTILVNNQPIDPKLGADELAKYLDSRLPEYAMIYFTNMCSLVFKDTNSTDLSVSPTDNKSWKEMLANPFLFYFQFNENTKRVQKIDKEANELFKEIDLALRRIHTSASNRHTSTSEGQSGQVNQKVKNHSGTNNNLLKYFAKKRPAQPETNNQLDNSQLENDTLTIILIVHILYTLSANKVDVLEQNGIPLLKVEAMVAKLEASEGDYTSFAKMIYNLGNKKCIWKGGYERKNIDQRVERVREFVNFVECFDSIKPKLKLIIVAFWSATVVIGSPFENTITLGYCLFKTGLMKDPFIWLVFRNSLIIKRLIIRENNCHFAWFEDIINKKKYEGKLYLAGTTEPWMIIKPRELIERYELPYKYKRTCDYRECFLKPGETQNSGKNIQIYYEAMEKVCDLFEDIYNEMNSIIEGVRDKVETHGKSDYWEEKTESYSSDK